jgi:hypothetical protein
MTDKIKDATRDLQRALARVRLGRELMFSRPEVLPRAMREARAALHNLRLAQALYRSRQRRPSGGRR